MFEDKAYSDTRFGCRAGLVCSGLVTIDFNLNTTSKARGISLCLHCSSSITVQVANSLSMAIIKRKGYTQKQESRKRQRKDVDSIDNLPWKIVSRSTAAGFEGDDGVLMLEEVDGVEVTYEETAAGKVAKFKVCNVLMS